MGVPSTCSALFSLSSCTSNVVVLFNVPYYWTFHSVVGFIICCHNIKFNIAQVVKRAHVVQIKRNEVVNYLIQHTQHKKSKYQRSNLSIQEIGRVRKRKNPRGRRKK